MRIGIFGVVALGLLTAACGSNTTQRSASGGLTGLATGAIIGGPVGAIAGAAVGAAGGWAMPEGADTLALNAIHKEKQVAGGALNEVGLGQTASGSSTSPQASASRQTAKQAQAELQREGLYRGPIDGIVGPETRQALAAYQAREGLQQTASLDRDTVERMNLRTPSSQTAQENRNAATSGSSTPQPPYDQGSGTSNPNEPSATTPAGNTNGSTSTSTDTGSNPGSSDNGTSR
ncbi:MAG TPA: peptidoglycan-binding domain-containing protein [Stellaceae bacterium]